MKVVLFIRKKLEGQNSMEELAQSLKSAIPELEIVELPYYSTSLIGMIKNGFWARKHQGQINHIFSITEGYLSLFLSGKKIITVHDLYFHKISFIGKIAIYLLWLLLPSFFTKEYTCISKETRKHLLKILPWVKGKVQTIYNPISHEFFQDYEFQPNAIPIILHIGTAIHKNLDKVIEAIAPTKYKLIIVGKLSEEQRNKLNDNHIDFETYYDISRKEIIELYKKSDIISFPSSQEGFGMIIIEANAMRKPVVAGDIPVLHEVGKNAVLYVNPLNVMSIREGFINLLNNNNERYHYIELGSINAKRFQLSTIATEYKSLYDYLSQNEC